MGQYSVNVFLIVMIELTCSITTEMKSSAFWMTYMYDRIKDKTICDLLIPGTVLSTSYQIKANTKVSAYNEPLLDIANALGLSQVSDILTFLKMCLTFEINWWSKDVGPFLWAYCLYSNNICNMSWISIEPYLDQINGPLQKWNMIWKYNLTKSVSDPLAKWAIFREVDVTWSPPHQRVD